MCGTEKKYEPRSISFAKNQILFSKSALSGENLKYADNKQRLLYLLKGLVRFFQIKKGFFKKKENTGLPITAMNLVRFLATKQFSVNNTTHNLFLLVWKVVTKSQNVLHADTACWRKFQMQILKSLQKSNYYCL